MTKDKAIEVLEYIKTFDGMDYGATKIALDMAIDSLKSQNLKDGTRVVIHSFNERGTILNSGRFRGKFAYAVLMDGDLDCTVVYPEDVEEIDE